MNRKNGCPLIVLDREPLEYSNNLVYCSEMGALCKGCPYPGHGFICWFADGTCLKTVTRKNTERGVVMAKTQNTRILDRFTGYSVADCDCRYCLYGEKKRGCKLGECCCAEERRQAYERERLREAATTCRA